MRATYENVQRHMTDKGVDVSTRQQLLRLLKASCEAVTSSVTEAATHELLEFSRLHIPDHVDYVKNHVVGKISNNVKVWWHQTCYPSQILCCTLFVVNGTTDPPVVIIDPVALFIALIDGVNLCDGRP